MMKDYNFGSKDEIPLLYEDLRYLFGIFSIKPNETKKIKFGFNVTLPKDLITVDIK